MLDNVRRFGGRVELAVRAAIQAFAYSQNALVPLTNEQWDKWEARHTRYYLLTHYYYNTIYSDIQTGVSTHREKSMHGLDRFTRGIVNPVSRLVNSYPARIYGGQLDWENLTTGAVPLVGAEDRLQDAIRQLWLNSNWQNAKSLYVHYGAMLGDVFLKIVDEPERGRVRIEPLHPGLFKDVALDAVGNVKECTIEYDATDENGKQFKYKEIITKESFSTYRNDAPWAFQTTLSGEDVSEWDNIYGFVPVVHVKHRDTGTAFGVSAPHNILGKIDEINSSASKLNDQISKTVNTIWAMKGMTGDIDITLDDTKGKIPFLKLPEGVEPYALVAPLDLSAAITNIDAMMHEIERDAPELALHRLREGGNMTAPGVRAGYSDAIDLFKEAMGNYDSGLIRAHKMGVTIGGIRGYKHFESFNETSFELGTLDHHIKERDVIEDSLSQLERMQLLVQLDAPKALIYEEMGFSDEQIEDAEAQGERDRQNRIEEAVTVNANNRAEALQQAGELVRQLNDGRQAGTNRTNGTAAPSRQPETAELPAAV